MSEHTPSLGLPTSGSRRRLPGIDWFAVVLPGLALVGVALWVTAHHLGDLHAAFWVIAAQAVVFELRPILATRQQPEGILLSTAFIFATLFLWGAWPAVVVMAVGNALSELRARHPLREAAFTIATLALGFSSAAATMALLGVRPTIVAPVHSIFVVDLIWMFLAWSVHFLVVHFLVNEGATLLRGPSAYPHFRAGFVDEFWFYVISDLVVVGLSPLVVVLAQTASPPLLLLIAAPFAAVWKGAAFSRNQEEVALHDLLTGLPNRRLFLERSADLLDNAKPHDRFALLLVDLDGFKEVNDTMGHHAGDLLLREVGIRVRSVVGTHDVAARLGGDEFAILVPGAADAAGGLRRAAILRESLQAPFEVEGQVLIIDGSVGVSLAPDHGRDVGELLRCADIAMYVAKRNSLGVLVYAEEDADEGESRGPGRGRAGRRAADVPLHTDVEPG